MAICFVLGIFGATGLMFTATQSLIHLQVGFTHRELRYRLYLHLALLLGRSMTQINSRVACGSISAKEQ